MHTWLPVWLSPLTWGSNLSLSVDSGWSLSCFWKSWRPNRRLLFSVGQSCPTLCNPTDCSMPGFPGLHCLPESAQTHVHWVSDAIQPFHPLSSPSPPDFNLSQHQGLFQWVNSSQQVAKVLELQLQHQVLAVSIKGWFPLGLTDWISLLSKGLSRVFCSPTANWKT